MAKTSAERTTEQPEHSIAPFVFFPSLILVSLATAVAIIWPDWTGEQLGNVQDKIMAGFGWYYVAVVTGFVVFALWVGISRFGDIRLGPDDEDADYGFKTWFSMLFAAGMGIGLVFWGVAEPLSFYINPKPGVEGTDVELAQNAMAQTFLHWGFHAWAIYAVVGLAMAWAIHRKNRPVSIRWALEPLFGDRVKGRLGDLIDVFAVLGTVAGVATSLGFGVQQISAGLVHLEVVDEATDGVMVALIIGITAIATLSVVSGLDKGIKWLSNFNIGLAGAFMLVVALLGSTFFLLRTFVENIGNYLGSIVPLSLETLSFYGQDGVDFSGGWTAFYWGWWISWAPFVGIFIARISRGRTVREFTAGVMLVPVTVSLAWFSVMGGSALVRQMGGDELRVEDPDNPGNLIVQQEGALFGLIGDLPQGTLLAGIAVVLITIFFITSSDSGSLVVDMLCHGGDPNPPTWSRVLWSVIEGLVAMGLLLAGGLAALRSGTIIAALPFSFIMILMCVATYRELSKEHREMMRLARKARYQALATEVTDELVENFDEHLAEPVDERIEQALNSDDQSSS